jgi:vacuolar-type H+-ATPase subunit H
MSNKSWKEAEDEAEKLVGEAQKRANEALERARQDAAELIARAEAEALARAEMIKKKGLLAIEEEVAGVVARGRKQVDELRAMTEKHIGRAADFIVRMVTSIERSQSRHSREPGGRQG